MVVTSQGKNKEGSTFFRVCCFFTVASWQGPHKGEQIMVTQQKQEEVAAKGTGLVLLTLALLVSAIAVPRLWPKASPRRVVRIGLLLLLAATVLLIALLDADATASVVTVPLLIIGLGIGALASQLGAVTVSSVPDKESSEVGGLQNTALNLGALLGTALVGSVLIATLTTLVLQGVLNHPNIPYSLKSQAQTTFGAGVPFVSDTTIQTALEAQRTSTRCCK